jgi:hypothetical protein
MDSSMSKLLRYALALTALVFPSAALTAQETGSAPLRVFIDCMFCDQDFMRTELTWVDYMRDRADAQVHVLVTSQSTGGGGQQYTIEFIGLKDQAAVVDTLRYTASSEDTEDIRRRALTRTIAAGLLRFVMQTPVFNRINISVAQAPDAAPGRGDAPPQRDPWNFWTFRINSNVSTNGESSQKSGRISGGLSANRTTEAWKFSWGTNGSYNEQSFSFKIGGNDTTITSISRNYNTNVLLVKSMGPHMSAGFRADAGTSTYGNTSLSVTFAPAIEYNIYPYAVSTRRQLTAQYSVGMRSYQYRETTIYDEIEETRPVHTLGLGYFSQQPWGSVNMSVDFSQYLHDTSKYNAGVFGGLSDIRLFKGFSFNVFGNYNLVRDQLALVKGDLTQDEILLRQKEVQTDYQYFVQMGISYRFGSIFNNVVNPRFGGGGGGMMIMF